MARSRLSKKSSSKNIKTTTNNIIKENIEINPYINTHTPTNLYNKKLNYSMNKWMLEFNMSTHKNMSTPKNMERTSDTHTPINNINICIVGCVSAGKSTILNALFRQDFAQAKIKRTTMVPTVFVEVPDLDNSACKQEDISSKIIEVNKEVIRLTEENKNLDLTKYQSSMIFPVNKLDVKISDNLLITLYDMPGLNDARTKNVYYEYLQENFYKFNIVIFVVDIYSGFNTSDEIDIVNLLT